MIQSFTLVAAKSPSHFILRMISQKMHAKSTTAQAIVGHHSPICSRMNKARPWGLDGRISWVTILLTLWDPKFLRKLTFRVRYYSDMSGREKINTENMEKKTSQRCPELPGKRKEQTKAPIWAPVGYERPEAEKLQNSILSSVRVNCKDCLPKMIFSSI